MRVVTPNKILDMLEDEQATGSRSKVISQSFKEVRHQRLRSTLCMDPTYNRVIGLHQLELLQYLCRGARGNGLEALKLCVLGNEMNTTIITPVFLMLTMGQLCLDHIVARLLRLAQLET